MTKNISKSHTFSLLLLQESLWGIEDKLNVIVESIADHEAEINRLKRLNLIFSERLNSTSYLRKSRNKNFNEKRKQFNKKRNS